MLDDEYCDYPQERAKFIICNFLPQLERCIERVDTYGSDGFDCFSEYVVERNIEVRRTSRTQRRFCIGHG